jgi:hypothetical protein
MSLGEGLLAGAMGNLTGTSLGRRSSSLLVLVGRLIGGAVGDGRWQLLPVRDWSFVRIVFSWDGAAVEPSRATRFFCVDVGVGERALLRPGTVREGAPDTHREGKQRSMDKNSRAGVSIGFSRGEGP